MERASVLIALVLFATGCTALVYHARYDIALSAVERRERGGETRPFTNVDGHTFEDEFIKVTWTPFDSQLGLIFKNKTDSSERILWDEIPYTGPDKKSDHATDRRRKRGHRAGPHSACCSFAGRALMARSRDLRGTTRLGRTRALRGEYRR